MNREHRIRGCLLGGAVGDALGAPVEFMSLSQIRDRYGPDGIHDLDEAYGRVGAITDDTQMTLFTAEGLLRAINRFSDRGICNVPGVIHHAYTRWLYTQGEAGTGVRSCDWDGGRPDGWLAHVPELHASRAPGNTCLTALMGGRVGSPRFPINNSKGCGGVMRVAPVGLVRHADPFTLGCEVAAITHGHPSGYLAAGAQALMIARIMEGGSLRDAADAALAKLAAEEGHEECSRAIRAAVEASSDPPSAETVESLGQGWVAEEALSIAVYCALVANGDFVRGVRLAVNHGGDSDSTGAITGNLLGACLGEAAIPGAWLSQLELRREIAALADDVALERSDGEEWWQKYPGW